MSCNPTSSLSAAPVDVDQVNRLGRIMTGCGRQMAAHRQLIAGDDTLCQIADALGQLHDMLELGAVEGVGWALQQLAEAERALPLVDAGITGEYRGGGR